MIDPARRIRDSLRISRVEGIPASVMLGVFDYYLIPLALFLGATTPQVGLLSALPHLLGSLSLLFAVRAVGWVGSRQRFVYRTAALQAALLIPVAALPLLAVPGKIWILIGLMTAFRVLLNLIGPAWGSLMSDYLPAEKRGIYFGGRARIVGAAQLASIALAGLALSLTKPVAPAAGFAGILAAACAARFISAWQLSRMADVPARAAPGADFTLFMFLRRFRESNFVRFVFYTAGIVFATFLAAPFFSVYMLRDLRFDYVTYMALHLSAVLPGLLALPVWGRHADAVGNARVLKTTGCIVPFIPLLWLVSGSPAYLLLVELVAGFTWGGFNLCATNFIYDAVTPEKRVRCLGYFNLINGIAIFAGTSLGGLLADRLPPFSGHRLLTLFALSGALRLLVHLLLAPRFQEVRASSRRVSSLQLFFSVVGIRPLLGEDREPILPLFKRPRR
ncbi:MAG: MFS transporter [Candidatus Omnitrophica bacterium]|nr:MFS transporter [Candidatus Omnitrophota bacterium]